MVNVDGLVQSVAAAMDWRLLGACRIRDTARFFESEGEGAVATRYREQHAKSLCRQCPVRAECAAHALSRPERHGVWGGFTSRERMRLLELGWEDLADERRTRVKVSGLESRLGVASTR